MNHIHVHHQTALIIQNQEHERVQRTVILRIFHGTAHIYEVQQQIHVTGRLFLQTLQQCFIGNLHGFRLQIHQRQTGRCGHPVELIHVKIPEAELSLIKLYLYPFLPQCLHRFDELHQGLRHETDLRSIRRPRCESRLKGQEKRPVALAGKLESQLLDNWHLLFRNLNPFSKIQHQCFLVKRRILHVHAEFRYHDQLLQIAQAAGTVVHCDSFGVLILSHDSDEDRFLPAVFLNADEVQIRQVLPWLQGLQFIRQII